MRNSRWKVVVHSQIGAKHSTCQDKSLAKELDDGAACIMAIADGHGSAACPLSETGARFAVEVANEILEAFQLGIKAACETGSAVKRLAEENLPRDIVRQWRERVENDWLERNPKAACAMKDTDYLKYGTTLICALVTLHHLFLLQLGDGDILLVTSQGEVDVPMPKDARLLGNETWSLCSAGAETRFRLRYLRMDEAGQNLALVLMSTDGYANSFATEDGFQQAGLDCLQLIRTVPEAVLREQLPAWLDETSREGSGDDMSLALLYRTSIVETGGEAPDAADAQTE